MVQRRRRRHDDHDAHLRVLAAYSSAAAVLQVQLPEKTSSTQAGLNSLFVGPDFHHSIRYPQISVVVFVSMCYSTGIPIMYLFITAAAFTFYWTDKYLFTRWYRTPPQYDSRISLQFSGYIPWAILIHCVFGTWMLANRRMFSSDHSVPTSSQSSTDSTGRMTLLPIRLPHHRRRFMLVSLPISASQRRSDRFQ